MEGETLAALLHHWLSFPAMDRDQRLHPGPCAWQCVLCWVQHCLALAVTSLLRL